MQVTPLPPLPVTAGGVPQETIAKTIPQVQAQAAAPIIQRAVNPSTKSERGTKSRSNGDRGKGGADIDASRKRRLAGPGPVRTTPRLHAARHATGPGNPVGAAAGRAFHVSSQP